MPVIGPLVLAVVCPLLGVVSEGFLPQEDTGPGNVFSHHEYKRPAVVVSKAIDEECLSSVVNDGIVRASIGRKHQKAQASDALNSWVFRSGPGSISLLSSRNVLFRNIGCKFFCVCSARKHGSSYVGRSARVYMCGRESQEFIPDLTSERTVYVEHGLKDNVQCRGRSEVPANDAQAYVNAVNVPNNVPNILNIEVEPGPMSRVQGSLSDQRVLFGSLSGDFCCRKRLIKMNEPHIWLPPEYASLGGLASGFLLNLFGGWLYLHDKRRPRLGWHWRGDRKSPWGVRRILGAFMIASAPVVGLGGLWLSAVTGGGY